MPVNRKVPDWLPLRLVSLIYPKNRKNTGGNRTGHVWVQYISLTYSGRIFPRHKEGIVSGNAGHLLCGEQTKPCAITKHYSVLPPVSHRYSSFLWKKLLCFSAFHLYLSTSPSLRSNSIAYFLRNLLQNILEEIFLHISIALFPTACRTCCHGLFGHMRSHSHCKKHGW